MIKHPQFGIWYDLVCLDSNSGATQRWNAWGRIKSWTRRHSKSWSAQKWTLPLAFRPSAYTKVNVFSGNWIDVSRFVAYLYVGASNEVTKIAS